MNKIFAQAMIAALFLLACFGEGKDAPRAYQRCIKCHGAPGGLKATIGPDLAKSEYTLDQFIKQVKNGSNWEGKPQMKQKFRKKKMPPLPNITHDQIKALYQYVHKK